MLHFLTYRLLQGLGRWRAALGMLALALTATALFAVEPDAGSVPLPPLSLARPDPDVLKQIQAYESGQAPRSLDVASFHGPDGRIVYLITPLCCDRLHPLYDAEARYICAPTGGFSGQGDGRCPAWARLASLWRQARVPPEPAGREQPWPPR